MISNVQIVFSPFELKRFQDRLNTLAGNVQRRVVRNALSAAGGVLRDIAKSLAREDTGLLKKSLAVKNPYVPKVNANTVGYTPNSYVLVGVKRKAGRMLRKSTLRGSGVSQRALVVERKRLKTEGSLPALKRERAAVRNVLTRFQDAIYRNPSRYAHILEGGHAKGKGRSSARAYPFIGPASQRPAVLERLKQKLSEGIAIESGLP